MKKFRSILGCLTVNHALTLATLTVACTLIYSTNKLAPIVRAVAATQVEGAIPQGGIPTTNPVITAAVDPSGNGGLGKIIFTKVNPSGIPVTGIVAAGSDGLSNAQVMYPKGFDVSGVGDQSGWPVTAPLVYNGATYDRLRGNSKGISVTGTSGAGPQGLTICDRQGLLTGAPTNANQLIITSGGAGLKTYVCSVTVGAPITNATSFKIIEGSGFNCGTGTNDLTPVFNIPIGDTRDFGGVAGNWVVSSAAKDICVAQTIGVSNTYKLNFAQY